MKKRVFRTSNRDGFRSRVRQYGFSRYFRKVLLCGLGLG
jgi:hypothetical protein